MEFDNVVNMQLFLFWIRQDIQIALVSFLLDSRLSFESIIKYKHLSLREVQLPQEPDAALAGGGWKVVLVSWSHGSLPPAVLLDKAASLLRVSPKVSLHLFVNITWLIWTLVHSISDSQHWKKSQTRVQPFCHRTGRGVTDSCQVSRSCLGGLPCLGRAGPWAELWPPPALTTRSYSFLW